MLHAYLVKIGFQYQKADNQKVVMKSPRLFAWRCKYLIKVQKYREDGYLIVYLDETWFLSHDTVRILWSDSTKSCSLSGLLSRGKWVVKCHHAGNSKSFLEYSLSFCGKWISMSYTDHHDDMSGVVFEDYLENMLTASLPEERKAVVVMENSKCHIRFIEHKERWNDCFYVKARYWNSESHSNKVSVIGKIIQKILKNSM